MRAHLIHGDNAGEYTQVARAALKTRVDFICKQRASEQMALQCSPSFSLSQTCATPGCDPTVSKHPVPASTLPFDPEQPWKQLFQQRCQHTAPPPAPAAHCTRWQRTSSHNVQHPLPITTARGPIGTPPSVEHKGHEARGEGGERSYSMASLRRGPLSFSSRGNDSVNHEAGTSGISGAQNDTTNRHVDGATGISGRRVQRQSIELHLPPPLPPSMLVLHPVRPHMQQSTLTARSSLRSDSKDETPFIATGARGISTVEAAVLLPTVAVRVSSPLQLLPEDSRAPAGECAGTNAIATTPLATRQADVLDRYWTSQHASSSLQLAQTGTTPSSEIAMQPATLFTSPDGGHKSKADVPMLPCFGPSLGVGGEFSAQATPRGSARPRPSPPLPLNPFSANSACIPHCPALPQGTVVPPDALFSIHSKCTAAPQWMAATAPMAKASISSRRTKGGAMAMVVKHATLQARHARSRQPPRSCAAPVNTPDPIRVNNTLPDHHAMCPPHAAGGVNAAAVAIRGGSGAAKGREDRRSMPAPLARRSRGARIAGMAIGHETTSKLLQPPTVAVRAPGGLAMGLSKTKRCAAATQKACGKAPGGGCGLDAPAWSLSSGRMVRSSSKLVLQARDLNASRPELKHVLPVCHVLGQSR
jgi:hypothetical protein